MMYFEVDTTAENAAVGGSVSSTGEKTDDRLLAYWKEQLDGVPALLELPIDFPRAATHAYQDGELSFEPGEAFRELIFDYCSSTGSCLSTVVLAGFSALLCRYSGQFDFCIGTLIARPNRSVLADRTLPLRVDLSGAPSFAELVRRVSDTLAGAHQHSDIAFNRLLEASGTAESASHAVLAQTGFIAYGCEVVRGTGAFTPQSTQFDLTLQVNDEGIHSCAVHYNAMLFKPDTVARLITHLQTLIESAIRQPQLQISELNLLTEREYHQVVFEWGGSVEDAPALCAHELFERHAAATPHAIAIKSGEQQLSYAELNSKANQLARYLVDRGVKTDVLVGLSVERSPDVVVAMLAILKAGGAYLPLDPTYPADRLAYMVSDAKPALVLTHAQLLGANGFGDTPMFCMDDEATTLAKNSSEDLSLQIDPSALAYVIYTSGSTGKPKGVMLAHRGLSNLCHAQAAAFEVDAESRVLQFASISFDAAVSETFVTLTRGACLYLIGQQALRSGLELVRYLEHHAISVVTLPPSLLAVLPYRPLPCLKTLVLAGEAWGPELARKWQQNRRLLNAYGPTEATVCATWALIETPAGNSIPIGRPLANATIRILDEHMAPTPIGIAGEIHIGGLGVARGYLNQPALTAERFISDAFSSDPEARLYRTGDKGRYLNDGQIEFLGRIDFQVKLRGYRIELGEIENALKTHDAVIDAVAVVREDYPGEKRLVAYVATENDLSPSVLKAYLARSLPDYMLPQHFVFMNALPLSQNGKIERRALPMPYRRTS